MIEADRSSSSDSEEDQVSKEEEGEEVKEQSKGKEVVNNGSTTKTFTFRRQYVAIIGGCGDVASGEKNVPTSREKIVHNPIPTCCWSLVARQRKLSLIQRKRVV